MSKSFFNYAAAAVAAYFGQYQLSASFLMAGVGAEKQRRARNQARDAYNASLQDRMVMLDLQPDAPRTLALGRVRTVEGIRRRWVSGTNSEKLTLIVSFAGHEIDGFEQFWFNDVALTLDGDGYVTKPAQLTGCSATRSGTVATLTKTAHGRADGEKVVIAGFSVSQFNGTFTVSKATANTFQYIIPTAASNPVGATGTVDVVSPYVREDPETHSLTGTLDGSGNASITLTSTPVSGTISAISTISPGTDPIQGELTVTPVSGLAYTLSGGPASAAYVVTWQSNVGTSFARIRSYLGTDTQSIGGDLAAEYPDHLQTTDHFRGIACAVVDLTFDPDVFPQGIPNITATLRGAKCLDPRDSSTAWTRNPALHAYHYARWTYGWAVPVGEIRTADIEDAADFCDTSTTFTLGADDVTLPRYQCDLVISSAGDPRAAMEDIMETMAGRWGWAGGTLRMRCGRMATPAFDLDTSWLAQRTSSNGDVETGAVVRITNGVPRESKVNRVAGKCIDPDQRYQLLPFPAVEDAVLIAAEGLYAIDAEMAGVANIAHAQHLASVIIRQAQAPLRMDATCNLSAYRCELFDVGNITVSRYGMTDKTMEVQGWRWHPVEGVRLQLAEITDEMFTAVEELNGRDPAPNGNLPPPWSVAVVTGVTVTADASLLPDGSVLTETLVEWTAPISQAVLVGGKIEVQYTPTTAAPPAGDWPSWIEQGGATAATIFGLIAGHYYLFRVRAINSIGVRGPWSAQVLHLVEGDTGAPDNVANLDWEIKPGQVLVTWDASTALDYAATELRVGASWAVGTFLWRGKGTDYKHARPANGTYTVWAAHQDTSGNYSATPASISVTVDDTIDAGTGGVVRLKTDRFPFFSFADGTTHTASGAGTATITITAQLVGLSGTPTFVATARDSGGGSLGTITLGGSGLIRTLTAAQFVSLGTSGGVRTVDVVATLGDATDDLTIYRQDSTTTAPRIYLSNPSSAIATDENGEGGDYSDASTLVEVYAGTSNDTSLWSFAITPDAGVTATINGGAGPVTGTGTVTLAVSAMTVPDGAVLVTATRTANPTLTATFNVTKNEGTGAYTVYWDPRAEIVLPLGADGAVSSYADAYSSLIIQRSGGPVDTQNWTYSKADSNVASELAGAYLNRVNVVGVPALGTISSSVSDAITLPTGWTRPQSLTWGPLGWVAFGYHASTNWQRVQTSSDFLSWTTVDVGTAGRWEFGAADDDGNVITIEFGVAGTNKVLRSQDGGATWGAVGSLGASAQWYSLQWVGDKFIVTPTGSTAARQSTDGITWSSLTMPANNCNIYGGPGRYLAVSSGAAYYLSTNGGSTWGGSISALSGLNHYSVKLFKGRLVVIPLANSTVYYSDDGVTWATSTLQHSVGSGPRLCEVVSGVLYVVGSDGKVQFTTDGKTWRYAGATASTSQQALGLGGYVDIQASLLPNIYSTAGNNYVRTPLLATSETEGFVVVTASKPGETDIVRALPVRRGAVTSGGFAFSAEPYTHSFPSTSDGVVTDYSGGVFTARASRDGVDDTSNWTWAFTTTNLTPSSGSSNVATITAFDSAQDTGTISYSASRAGYQTITGTLVLRKAKGTTDSGPRMGVGYAVIDTANTLIGVRFNSDGSVDVKRGSGGSYTRLTQWAGAVVAGVGSSYWIYIDPAPSTHALSTGTTDTWLALSSARTYEMSDATSGIHEFDAEVFIGSSSSGANAVGGSFSMRLIVP